MASGEPNGKGVSSSASKSLPYLISNSSTGLKILRGSPPHSVVKQLTVASVRAYNVSRDGNVLVYSEGAGFNILRLDQKELSSLKIPVKEQVHDILLSPQGKHVAIFCTFKSPPPGSHEEPNLLIYTVDSASLVGSFTSKKQITWQPQWSDDENIFIRLNGTELHCYEKGKYDRWVRKSENIKVSTFSFVQNTRNSNYYVACYTAGNSTQPSAIRMYRYPNLSSPMTTKSFFKADSVQLMWSPRGDGLLYLCISEVDKTGKSYYGEQKLNYMEANPSGSGYIVPLSKDGPIHNVAWLPGSTDVPKYIVIHGFVPPRVSMFDAKGNLVFDFGGQEYSFNQIIINPFGNLVCLAGLGNMRGTVSVWEMQQKKLVSEFNCQDSTYISWAPDGATLLTATTSPRLRVGNGFKLWNYNGTLIHDSPVQAADVELYSVQLQPRPGVYSMPSITIPNKPVVIKTVTSGKYVPPSIRNRNEGVSQIKSQASLAPPASSSLPSRESKGASRKKQTNQRQQQQQQQQQQQSTQSTSQMKNDASTGTDGKNDVSKKIAKINRKLQEIDKLKSAQNFGSELKNEQLNQISKEQELRTQLQQLQLSK